MATVLIAVTNARKRAAQAQELRAAGFTTVLAGEDKTPRRILDSTQVEIIILDRSQYGKDLLRQVRDRQELRILAVCTNDQDRVRALESGADQVAAEGDELIAQLHALERRLRPRGVINAGDLLIDVDRRAVIRNGEVIELRPMEFSVLLFLASHPHQIFTHREIYEEVWRAPLVADELTTVTEHVYRIRARVEKNPHEPRHLVTVRGAGYRFEP